MQSVGPNLGVVLGSSRLVSSEASQSSTVQMGAVSNKQNGVLSVESQMIGVAPTRAYQGESCSESCCLFFLNAAPFCIGVSCILVIFGGPVLAAILSNE